MINELGAFPVPQIVRDKIDPKHIGALFEQGSSGSDSAGEEPRRTASKGPRRRRRRERLIALRKHLSDKRNTSNRTERPSEKRQGRVTDRAKCASPESRKEYSSDCVAELDTSSHPPKEMPRQKPPMLSQVDMFAQSPRKDEDMIKEEGTPQKLAASSKTVQTPPRRSSRVKNQEVSSTSGIKAPTGPNVNPKLKTTKKEELTDDESASSDSKSNAKELAPSCAINFTDSDDDIQISNDVFSLIRGLDAVVSKSENSSQSKKTRTNSPNKDFESKNKSPKKGVLKDSNIASPDKFVLQNATGTQGISYLVQPPDVVATSEPAMERSIVSFIDGEMENNPQAFTHQWNGNIADDNAGGDEKLRGGASAKPKEVTRNTPDRTESYSPFQRMRRSLEHSPVPKSSRTAHEVRNVSPRKTPLKDDSIRKSPVNSSDDSGAVANFGKSTGSGHSLHRKDVSGSSIKPNILHSDSESEKGLTNASTDSEDNEKAKEVDNSKRSLSPKATVVGKKTCKDMSDSQPKSSSPQTQKAKLQTSFSSNQLRPNRSANPSTKDEVKSNESDSSESSNELSQAGRNPKNVCIKSSNAKKETNIGLHGDSCDLERLYFTKLGPTATSTQKIVPLSKSDSSDSESNASEADVKTSTNKMKRQTPILPRKSGASAANKPHADGNDAESESSDSEDGSSTSVKKRSSTPPKTKGKLKGCSSGSASESSGSGRENSSKRVSKPSTPTVSSGRSAVKKEDSSNTGSSQSEDENAVKFQQLNAPAPKALQSTNVPKPRINSSSRISEPESVKSGKGDQEAENNDFRKVNVTMKDKNKGSSSDSDSSQSGDEKPVKARHLDPVAAAQGPPMKNSSKQSENSESESDSEPSEDGKTDKNVVAPQTPRVPKPQLDRSSSNSESDSDQSKEGKNGKDSKNTDSRRANISVQVKKNESSSDSSQSDDGKPVKAHSLAMPAKPPLMKNASKQSENSDSESDSSLSKDGKPVKARHSPAMPAKAPLMTNASKQSESSDSGSDSSQSGDGKPVKAHSPATSKKAPLTENASRQSESSDSESDASQSGNEKPVKAHSPATTAKPPLMKNASKQSENSDSESDSSLSTDRKPVKAHSSVTHPPAPHVESAPQSSESSDSQSDSSDSGDEKIRISHQAGAPQVSLKGVDVKVERKEKDSGVKVQKVGAAPTQPSKQFSNSRTSEKSSSDADSTDSENEEIANLATSKVESKKFAGVESRKQAIERAKEMQDDSSDSDSNSSVPDKSPTDGKISVKPIEHPKNPPSATSSTGNVKGNPKGVLKEHHISGSSSSSDSSPPVQNEKRFSKQSVGVLDTKTNLKRKASEISSSDSNSLQSKAKLQKLCSPVNQRGTNIAASGNGSTSTSSSGESDSDEGVTLGSAKTPRGGVEARKGDDSAPTKSLADNSTHTAELSVSRKRKADSVSSPDSSDSEPKTKQRKVETPVTPVAQHWHPVNSTVYMEDNHPVFPGSDISFIPKPTSTPSSKVNPNRATNQRSILDFAKQRDPVSSTPELPQKNIRNKLDLLKSEYLKSGYRDVGDQFDFDSHPGLFEEDLLKNDSKVYIVQCPKEVDPESLVGQKIDLSKRESLIKLTGKCGTKVPYEVYCDLSESDVGVSLITPSKRQKKFTLASVPVAGRVTIAETLHVPTVREVASKSPPRVPFPENLKPRNPFVDSDDSTAQEILKKIKQKSRKGQHEYSAPSSTLPLIKSEPNAKIKTTDKKQKRVAQRATEVQLPSKSDFKSYTKPEAAVPQEPVNSTFEDVKMKKKKKKKDKSSVDTSAPAESSLKDAFSSNTTGSFQHKPLAAPSYAPADELKKKKKKKKDKEHTKEEVPVAENAEHFPKESCVLTQEPIPSGESYVAFDKKKKKRKREEECLKEELTLPSEGLLNKEPLPTSESYVAFDKKKKKKKRKKEEECLKEELILPSEGLLSKEPLPTMYSDITSSKKKKKKKKKHEELDSLENPRYPNKDEEKQRNQTADPSNEESGPSITKKKKKKHRDQ